MRYIFLFTKKENDLQAIRRSIESSSRCMFRVGGNEYLLVHSFYPAGDDSFFVSEQYGEHVQFEIMTLDSSFEYSEPELNMISELGDYNLYILKWGSDDFLLEVLGMLSKNIPILVDDEQTTLKTGADFLKYIENNPGAYFG